MRLSRVSYFNLCASTFAFTLIKNSTVFHLSLLFTLELHAQLSSIFISLFFSSKTSITIFFSIHTLTISIDILNVHNNFRIINVLINIFEINNVIILYYSSSSSISTHSRFLFSSMILFFLLLLSLSQHPTTCETSNLQCSLNIQPIFSLSNPRIFVFFPLIQSA